MHRKEFLKKSLGLGACCAAAFAAGSVENGLAQDGVAAPAVSPCDKKVLQGQAVIRRLMIQLDEKLDQPTREAVMESCGRGCFQGANGKAAAQPPSEEQRAKFLERMRKYLGNEGVQQSAGRTVVYFKYTSNPKGLKTEEGYCLCPILEDAPKDISPTYCLCSVGYVKEIFERNVGKPVDVKLTESVLRGGKTCRFTVEFKA